MLRHSAMARRLCSLQVMCPVQQSLGPTQHCYTANVAHTKSKFVQRQTRAKAQRTHKPRFAQSHSAHTAAMVVDPWHTLVADKQSWPIAHHKR